MIPKQVTVTTVFHLNEQESGDSQTRAQYKAENPADPDAPLMFEVNLPKEISDDIELVCSTLKQMAERELVPLAVKYLQQKYSDDTAH